MLVGTHVELSGLGDGEAAGLRHALDRAHPALEHGGRHYVSVRHLHPASVIVLPPEACLSHPCNVVPEDFEARAGRPRS